MATFRPERARLAAQVDSIRSQTVTDWHCWVVDDGSEKAGQRVLQDVLSNDPRFTLVTHPDNVGFYRNFERALSVVPAGAMWVALSDQDDLWYPDKLERLLNAAGAQPSVRMVYSDVEIRDSRGLVISPTYWVGRRHNEDDLAALLFANTVTGAAAMVHRDVLIDALPFPPQFATSFHDHWLALVARTTGRVVYVERALQAYIQHEENAIGHQPAPKESALAMALRNLKRAWWRRPSPRYYNDEVARLSSLADELLRRIRDLNSEDRRILQAVASLHATRPALGWLVLQAVRESMDPTVTMWRRRRVLASVIWTFVERAQSARRSSGESS